MKRLKAAWTKRVRECDPYTDVIRMDLGLSKEMATDRRLADSHRKDHLGYILSELADSISHHIYGEIAEELRRITHALGAAFYRNDFQKFGELEERLKALIGDMHHMVEFEERR